MIGLWLSLALAGEVGLDVGVTGRAAYYLVDDTEGEFSATAPNYVLGGSFAASNRDHWLVGLVVAPDSDLQSLARLAGQLGWSSVRLEGEHSALHVLPATEVRARRQAGEPIPRGVYDRVSIRARAYDGIWFGLGTEVWAHPIEGRVGRTSMRLYGMSAGAKLLENLMTDEPDFGYVDVSAGGRLGAGMDADFLVGVGDLRPDAVLWREDLEDGGPVPRGGGIPYVGLSSHTRAVGLAAFRVSDGWVGFEAGAELHALLHTAFVYGVPTLASFGPLVGVRAAI